MNKTNSLILALIILAILGFGLFFINQMRLAENESILAEQLAEFDQQQTMMLEAQQLLQAEREASVEQARLADEARRMAEAQAEQERAERQRLVDELNARLQREAAERREAEAAQQLLAEKMQQLEAAQIEAQAALAALEAEGRVEVVTDEQTLQLREKIKSQEQALAALSSENQSLKEQQQLIEQRQIATEEAIIEAGGKIELPYPEIRSPNIRRREAIYFKERVLGHPGGI